MEIGDRIDVYKVIKTNDIHINKQYLESDFEWRSNWSDEITLAIDEIRDIDFLPSEVKKIGTLIIKKIKW